MTLQDKMKAIKHCATSKECKGCPAFIIKDGDRRCAQPEVHELAFSIISELTEPATIELTEPTTREELWRMNIDALAAGAYGDPKDPATLVIYWSNQADAGFPGAEENLKYFVKLAEKTRPKTVEDRVAEIKQVMELCEQVWKEH